jgi:hypothetical protein
MKRTSSLVIALALLASCTGIAFATNNPGSEAGPKEPKVVTYPITAIGGSGQHGTVVLKQLSATQTQVTITLTGEPSAANEPSHIHSGACPSPGAVKWPLSNVVHGTSVTTLDVPFSQINQSGFAVNVHQSPTSLGVYKACGNIMGG